MNEEVTISAAEYKELLEAQASIKAFARYVDMVKYSVDREVYAALLGFALTGRSWHGFSESSTGLNLYQGSRCIRWPAASGAINNRPTGK